MLTIKNLTNSPHPIVLADGTKAILPARGRLENVEVHPLYLTAYRSLGYFQITESETKVADPLDHDGDGKKGGSQPASDADDEVLRLRAEYTDLTDKKPHHLWRAERLQTEIDKALEG